MALSREWVCVRLASYEDEEEGAYLTDLYRGRTGLLNNTTFALLAPDGETLLDRSGRGPAFLIDMPHAPDVPATREQTRAFALKLDEYTTLFEPTADLAALPQALDYRRALNVAACDNQPLVVAYAKSRKERERIEKELATLAWQPEFLGRLQYLVVEDRDQLSGLAALPKGDLVVVLQPDLFGLEGTILRKTEGKPTSADLRALLISGLQAFQREDLDRRRHFEQGRQAGVGWETVMPVTDEGKNRGRSR